MSVPSETGLGLRTRNRVTRRLIPYLMLLYLLAYVDRANIGVAKLGMQADTGFDDRVIGLGAGIFFVGFLVMNLPAGFLVERWSARRLMALIMIAWGMMASMMGLVGTPLLGSRPPTTEFYLLRLGLGIAEAGFFPGVIVYLSHWYRPADRARAKGYFMLSQPIAIAIGVPVSGWILRRVHWAGVAGWRWVFLLEGALPILMGLVSLWYLTDRPEDAAWLRAEERSWLIDELERDRAQKAAAHRVGILDALGEPHTFLLLAILFLIVTANQTLIFFLPSITSAMKALPAGLRETAAGLPFVFSAVGILVNGIWAERSGGLRWHTAVPVLATGISLSLAALEHRHAGLMVALLCLAGLTAQAYLPSFWTLPTTIFARSAAATAVGVISLGNLGGLAGPWLFGYLRTATGNYDAGLRVMAGCMILAGILATQIRAGSRLRKEVPHDAEEKQARGFAQL